jgi:GNAT superfamily N-acetyltransferase
VAASPEPVSVDWFNGDRAALRPLFELAEDSASELDSTLRLGRILVARTGPGTAGEIVGHLQLVDAGRPGEVELKNMAVREDHQGRGVGARLVGAACALLTAEGTRVLHVATAAADVGNLRFYQRQGFRMRSIEPDVFTPARGYPAGTLVDGVELRDRVWFARVLR